MYAPPNKNKPPPEKNLTPHHLKKVEHPDKKLYALVIILIPRENLKPLETYQPSPTPPKNLSIPLNILNFNTMEKLLTPPEKSQTLPKTSPPLQKQFKPLPEKSQPL